MLVQSANFSRRVSPLQLTNLWIGMFGKDGLVVRGAESGIVWCDLFLPRYGVRLARSTGWQHEEPGSGGVF